MRLKLIVDMIDVARSDRLERLYVRIAPVGRREWEPRHILRAFLCDYIAAVLTERSKHGITDN